MTLRDDVRDHFQREESRFPTPAGLRDDVTARASVRSVHEPRRIQWAAAVAVLLAVSVVAGLLGTGALRHTHVAPAAAPSPKAHATWIPGPSPQPNPTIPVSTSGMSVVEVDTVDASTGFALLFNSPATGGWRQFWFSSTIDGGLHWSIPVKVGPPLAQTEGDSGHHIHFVDASDGFVYGNSTAFVTHDGGRTWGDSGLHFLEMVAAAGRAPWTWVVTYPCAKGTTPPCPYKAYLSADGGRTWQKSFDLDISPARAIAFGSGGLLVSGYGAGDMDITRDQGSDWSRVLGRCSANAAAAYVATSDGQELWQMCSGDFPDTTPKALYVSEDGGGSWAQRTLAPGVGSVADLVSPTQAIGFLATDQTPIAVTRDGGATWALVTSASGFTWLEFTSETEGWALATDHSIWATHDGGRTWVPLPALP